ncbi:MAG: radical SAM family heme chaperone HemW [Eubacteriales bacterium]|nr:radical SAM family heme chaperone HemW [Eubacteriales bacterium]
MNPISLYIHIPFCLRKCSYCDFLSAPRDRGFRTQYVRALSREIQLQGRNYSDVTVDTVFFGGGTPTVLTAGELSGILDTLRVRFRIQEDAEISLEMNPGTADGEKLRVLKRAGFNRLSIGVQSMQDKELKILGRIHSAEQAREAYRLAREAGFDNINLDLMSGLPGQTFQDWSRTLEQAAGWKPEHISAYSLIIEPGTPFAALREAGKLAPLPDEETEREMYRFTEDFLSKRGFARYEISNYAKPGRECRHNTGYWTGHAYLGLGTGAASYVDGVRWSNISNPDEYMKILCAGGEIAALQKDVRRLSAEERMEEFMFLGLRMTGGVRAEDFSGRFGKEMEEVYGSVMCRQIGQGVLERTDGGVRLTARGIDVSNYVLADYLL